MNNLTKKQIGLFGLIGTFILLFLYGLTIDPQVTEQMKQQKEASKKNQNQLPKTLIEQIKADDSDPILDVRNHSDRVLEIDIKATDTALNDADYLTYTGYQSKAILLKILATNSKEPYKYIRFVVIGNFKDQYNRTFTSPLYHLTFDLEEIKKIQIDNDVNYLNFFYFAKFTLRHSEAGEMYRSWCLKDDNWKDSGDFCKGTHI